MKVIAQKLLDEPAVAIGLLVTIALVVVNVIGGETWTLETIIEVAAPFLTALGIRPAVTPLRKLPPPPAETTYQKVTK